MVSPGSQVLTPTVEAFVAPIAQAVHTLALATGRPSTIDQATDDATVEAFNLCCAIVDADGRHTDDELWAMLATFGPRFPTQLGMASPDDVRRSGLLAGKKQWLDAPSPLFDLIDGGELRGGNWLPPS